MTRKNRLGKILFCAAVLSVLLCLAAAAHADVTPCTSESGLHGNFRWVITLEPTCTEEGSRDKYCGICGQKIGTESIGFIPHPFYTEVTVIKKATCTTDGLQQKKEICSVCGYTKSVTDEVIPAAGHDWDEGVVTTRPTCTEKGQKTFTCKNDSSHKRYEDVDPTGHNYGEWTVTTAPQCEAQGEETCVCANDPTHKKTRPVAATDHNWDAGVVTKVPTCTEKGVKTYTCQNNSAHTRTEEIDIDPNAHDWDNGRVTTPPDCTNKGVKIYTCRLNSSHTRTEEIPVDPNAHNWNEGVITTPAGCETDGVKTYTCQINSTHVRTETIPHTGHAWDQGTVIREPTLTVEGIRHYVCQNDHTHTRDENMGTLTFGNNTLCAFGPRLRDVNLYPYDTDLWYMFTPFDATKDGKQTFELVVSNNYIVGTLTLEVKDGNVIVDYTLNSNTIDVTLEFFTILSNISDITEYEPEKLISRRMVIKQPISLEENFGEDRNLVLYFCSRCNYTYSNRFSPLDYKSATHQRILTNMLTLMAEDR